MAEGMAEKEFAARITELAERSLKEQEPQWSDFLEPPEREQAQAVVGWVTGVRFNSYGGYFKAERRRLVVYPDYYIVETIEPALAFLEVQTSSPTPLTHRDYLGSLMALGLKREKFGDILVDSTGPPFSCQLVVVPELADYIKFNLERVGNQKALVKEIEAEQLNIPDLREKQIKSTVASLRLDAIVALGFSESRTRMAKEIKAEKVKVNWKVINDPDYQVAAGDVISFRGRGRMLFREQTGQSKKGRLGVLLVRYL
ncbi:MAG TPA: photosystem II S4 domain protein [Firmicutes bacterium]|jgi:RNA-binding protein YlmH|nr:photosystem II S4 domain protein [Bacillota bacterium]